MKKFVPPSDEVRKLAAMVYVAACLREQRIDLRKRKGEKHGC